MGDFKRQSQKKSSEAWKQWYLANQRVIQPILDVQLKQNLTGKRIYLYHYVFLNKSKYEIGTHQSHGFHDNKVIPSIFCGLWGKYCSIKNILLSSSLADFSIFSLNVAYKYSLKNANANVTSNQTHFSSKSNDFTISHLKTHHIESTVYT